MVKRIDRIYTSETGFIGCYKDIIRGGNIGLWSTHHWTPMSGGSGCIQHRGDAQEEAVHGLKEFLCQTVANVALRASSTQYEDRRRKFIFQVKATRCTISTQRHNMSHSTKSAWMTLRLLIPIRRISKYKFETAQSSPSLKIHTELHWINFLLLKHWN